MPQKKVLIVGAGGFIGGFIAAESLRRGYETWCGVRESTSRRYLTDPALQFITLDYDNPERLAEQLKGHRWDYIVYNLGATKCVNFMDFNRINYVYLRDFVETLQDVGAVPERMVYMSSLSAIGPGDEKNYTPLTAGMNPQPNTRYGRSKIMAEQFLEHFSGLNWTIFRPTGVYGPHEKDYLMMIQSIDRHFDFSVGFRRQMLTFIYVDDLVEAMFDALASPDTIHKKYIIAEDRAYTQKEFRAIVARALGKGWVLPVKLPLWAVRLTSVIAGKIGKMRMKPSTLNPDKYLIMAQRNWCADTSEARRDFGFKARVDLAEGIRRTVEAYRKPGSK